MVNNKKGKTCRVTKKRRLLSQLSLEYPHLFPWYSASSQYWYFSKVTVSHTSTLRKVHAVLCGAILVPRATRLNLFQDHVTKKRRALGTRMMRRRVMIRISRMRNILPQSCTCYLFRFLTIPRLVSLRRHSRCLLSPVSNSSRPLNRSTEDTFIQG